MQQEINVNVIKDLAEKIVQNQKTKMVVLNIMDVLLKTNHWDHVHNVLILNNVK